MKRVLIILLTLITTLNYSQDLSAFKIFNSQGQALSYNKMIKDLLQADFIFFGELHNNPISHWLELEVSKSLYQHTSKLILGAEMFEADVQLILDEFLADQIREKDVKKEARVWHNYSTDYKPLLMFAKENKLNFIATNIPRRYANLVYRKGFEALNNLSPLAKKYIAPLPIEYDPEIKCYKNMLKGMVHMGMPANPNIAKAQAIKDATMAYFISKNYKHNYKFIHFNGAYHSDDFLGIIWYLQKLQPNAKIMTITTVEQENIDKLQEEYLNKANFIIVVPSNMTKTY